MTVAPTGIARAVRTAVTEVWGLFVDDGALAIVAILAIFGVALFATHYGDGHSIAGALLIVGVLLAIWAGLHDASKASSPTRRAMAGSQGPADGRKPSQMQCGRAQFSSEPPNAECRPFSCSARET